MLVYDLADATELAAYVRTIPLEDFPLLRNVLPIVPIDDIDYRLTTGDFSDMDVAQFRALDTESGIGDRKGASRLTGELPPISKKMRLGEEQRLRLNQLQRQSQQVKTIAEQIFDDALRLGRAVLGRLELAAGETVSTGKVTIAENGFSGTIGTAFPSGQTPTAAVSWLDPSADFIGEYTTWVEAYADRNNGALPALTLVDSTVRNALLKNTQIQKLLRGNVSGAAVQVTQQQLADAISAFELPPLQVYRRKMPLGGTPTRAIAASKAIMLPAGGIVGATFSGITAEALTLTDARQLDPSLAPGMVVTTDVTSSPVATWTEAVALAAPVLANPSLITSANVVV